MTNEMIILNESVRLMESGKLKGTGKFMEMKTADGATKKIEIPEEIHTFAAWKELGYSVKKGEKSKIKIQIWKHTSKTVENEDGETEEKTNMFMKVAAFFSPDQVERITARA